MASCYEFRLDDERASPWLPSVDCAVILTMRDSTRLQTEAAQALRQLCGRTYVQVNEGYRTCAKPAWVRKSCDDIVHAYAHAFERVRGMGLVLVLADDAEIMAGATRADLGRVDAFVKRLGAEQPELAFAYSMGIVGNALPIDAYHTRIATGKALDCANAQAIIWSPASRERLLAIDDKARIVHIDGGFLSTLPAIYSYRDPLVVQRFPLTENMKTWRVLHLTSPIGERIDAMYTAWFVRVLLHEYLRLHEGVAGWRVLYAMNLARGCGGRAMPVVLLLLLCATLHRAQTPTRR